MIFPNYIVLLAFQIGFITLPLGVIQAELLGNGLFAIVSFFYISFVVFGIILTIKFICKALSRTVSLMLFSALFLIAIIAAYADVFDGLLWLYAALLIFIFMPAGAAIGLERIRRTIRIKIFAGLIAALVVIIFGWTLATSWDDGLGAFSGEEREYAESALRFVNSECIRQGFNRLSDISSEGRHRWRVASVDLMPDSDTGHRYRAKIQFYSWMRLPTYAIHLPPLDNRGSDSLCARTLD